jgi:hypothetical protein
MEELDVLFHTYILNTLVECRQQYKYKILYNHSKIDLER